MRIKVKYRSAISLLIWITLISGYPFVFTYMIGYPKLLPMLAATILLLLYCFANHVWLKKEYGIMLTLMLIYFIICIIYHNDAIFLSSITQIFIVAILLTIITKVISIEKFITQYIKVITAIAVLGAIGAIIVFVFNTPYLFQYAQQDGRLANVYFLTVTNTPGPPIEHPVIRYSGVFDEPGALAFFCMIALCLNKLYYHNARIEKLLMIVPLLTFSMAYIITDVVYVFLFKIKTIKGYIIAFSTIVLLVIGIISLKDTPYQQLYNLSVARFEQDDSGEVKGNSRAVESGNAKEAFNESPIMGIGIDEKRAVSNNYYSILATYGIIGYIVIHLFILYVLIKAIITHSSDKWLILKCLFILLLNLQQRPFNTNVVYFTSILLIIIYSDRLLTQSKLNQKCYLAS